MNKNVIYGIIAGVVLLFIFSYFSLGLNKNGSDSQKESSENSVIIDRPEDLEVNDIAEGEGAPAISGDTVVVHYDAYLEKSFNSGEKGALFESTRKNGNSFEAMLGAGEVIEGFDLGVQGMKVGGKRTIIIPSKYAYGEIGSGPIPPNSNLIFEVELLEIK